MSRLTALAAMVSLSMPAWRLGVVAVAGLGRPIQGLGGATACVPKPLTEHPVVAA